MNAGALSPEMSIHKFIVSCNNDSRTNSFNHFCSRTIDRAYRIYFGNSLHVSVSEPQNSTHLA
jgi:hypothetical protein